MAIHRDCGAEIEWPRREDDPERFGRPLEFAGSAYILTEDRIAVRVLTYKEHECDPDIMEEWIARCKRIEELQGYSPVAENPLKPKKQPVDSVTYAAYKEKRDELLKAQWKTALKVDCTICGVAAGKKCRSLHKHENNRILKRPHWLRISMGEDFELQQ